MGGRYRHVIVAIAIEVGGIPTNVAAESGVVVVGVNANSKADKAGIQKGDLIKEVNRQGVESVGQFKELIRTSQKGDGIDLLLKRMNAGYVVVHLA